MAEKHDENYPFWPFSRATLMVCWQKRTSFKALDPVNRISASIIWVFLLRISRTRQHARHSVTQRIARSRIHDYRRRRSAYNASRTCALHIASSEARFSGPLPVSRSLSSSISNPQPEYTQQWGMIWTWTKSKTAWTVKRDWGAEEYRAQSTPLGIRDFHKCWNRDTPSSYFVLKHLR